MSQRIPGQTPHQGLITGGPRFKPEGESVRSWNRIDYEVQWWQSQTKQRENYLPRFWLPKILPTGARKILPTEKWNCGAEAGQVDSNPIWASQWEAMSTVDARPNTPSRTHYRRPQIQAQGRVWQVLEPDWLWSPMMTKPDKATRKLSAKVLTTENFAYPSRNFPKC